MAKKEQKFGLEAIFGENFQEAFADIENFSHKQGQKVDQISIKQIRPNPFQPRKNFKDEELKELAASIAQHGLISPVVVLKDIKGYTLVSGERRFRACQNLGWKTIKALVVKYTPTQMAEIALVENLQRADLNSVEEAQAFEQLIKTHNLTQEQVGIKVAKSRSYVTNALRLLKLPPYLQKLLLTDQINSGQAKVLMALLDQPQLLKEVTAKVVKEKISVRDLEKLLKRLLNPSFPKTPLQANPDLAYAQKLLREKFKTKVEVSLSKVMISYQGINDLNRILEILKLIE